MMSTKFANENDSAVTEVDGRCVKDVDRLQAVQEDVSDDDISKSCEESLAAANNFAKERTSGICKTEDVGKSDGNATDVSSQNQQQDQNTSSSIKHQAQGNCNKNNVHAPSMHKLSVTATILGNTSDRDDFLPRGNSDTSLDATNDDNATTENEGGIINGVKKWFSSSPTACDTDYVEHDYHRNEDHTESSSKSRKASKTGKAKNISLSGNDYDESLLENETSGDLEMGRRRTASCDGSVGRRNADTRDDYSNGDPDANEGGDGKHKFKYTNGGWGNKGSSKVADDELRVMGECSFFYDGMGNEESHSPSHRIPGCEHNEDEKENGYFEEGHPHKYHRARVVNPRAMAQAISSTARRQWTERRYRRRLNQSTFVPPLSIWKKRHHQHHNDQSTSDKHQEPPSYELTTEHRQAFLAAHSALNDKLANEYSRNKHAINIADYDYELDLDLNLSVDNQLEEIRADLTKSSLAIRGSGQIRLPVDNVRLVMDSYLQPGILSVESRAGGYMGYENYGNGNRYGVIKASEVVPLSADMSERQLKNKKGNNPHRRVPSELSTDQPWRRNELSYVLTVDDQLYQRLFQEISDSYRLPCGMYYCCHLVESEASHDHVEIGVAVAILMVVFTVLVVGMLVWPV